MTASLVGSMSWLLAQATEIEDKLSLDSQILAEQFYFFTVVIMWLIHVGFMSYEAGAARRKNIMSTAIKNILTIAVVTPTFYYFGWYIYGCFEHGGPAQGHAGPDPEFPGFCGATAPWADAMGPNSGRLSGWVMNGVASRGNAASRPAAVPTIGRRPASFATNQAIGAIRAPINVIGTVHAAAVGPRSQMNGTWTSDATGSQCANDGIGRTGSAGMRPPTSAKIQR